MAKRKPERWEEVTYKWQTLVLNLLESMADERDCDEEFASGRKASELRCTAQALRLARQKLLETRSDELQEFLKGHG